MKREIQPPETPLDQYRIYRGLSKTDLGKRTGLSRSTIDAACSGTRSLTDSSLEKIASALCVDPFDLAYDPSDPMKDVYDIQQAMADISAAIALCRPRQLEKKAPQIIAYLGCDDRSPSDAWGQPRTPPADEDRTGRAGQASGPSKPAKGRELTGLEAAAERLLFQISSTGISLILYHLKYLCKKVPVSGQTFARKLDTPLDSLEFYREQRNLNIEELKDLCGISRQTLLKLRKGKEPSTTQLGSLSYVLHVDALDLVQGPASFEDACRVVDIRAAAKAIEDAVRQCSPSLLRVRVPHILAYLQDAVNDALTDIMAYLLTPSSQGQPQLVMDYTQVLSRYVYFRRDHTSSIYIGYCSSEYEEPIYDACILFEEWVYAMFCLDCPQAEAAWEIPDGYGRLARRGPDFSITVWTEKEPGDEDFESVLLEQAEEYCHNDYSQDIPDLELVNIFRDFVSDNLWGAEIVQYQTHEMDLERPLRLMRRREQYQNLLYHLASLHAGADLAEAIAFHFSWFKEDPEYERKLLGEMELGEPV